MTAVTLPDNSFRSVRWTLVQPTQQNRSEFTSARQVMQLPGASYWKVDAEHIPIIGEANIRGWRSFFAQLNGQANVIRFPATEGNQHSGSSPRAGIIGSMTNLSNTTISGSDNGTVTRTTGGGAWTAAAYSSGRISGSDVTAEFTANQTNKAFMVGLNQNATASSDKTDIPFAWYCKSDGNLEIWENNVQVVISPGVYTTGTILGLKYTGSGVQYIKDGVVVRTATASASQVFRVDSSLFDSGASFSLVRRSTAAGVTSIFLSDLPASATTLKAGMFATLPGTEQLVVLTADVAADSAGFGTMSFLPMSRGTTTDGAQVQTVAPWALMAMDSPEIGYSVDPGARYGFAFSATEAY